MSRHAMRWELSDAGQSELKQLLTGGVQQVRVTLGALALLRLQQGLTAPQVAPVVQLTDQAVRQIARRYRAGAAKEDRRDGVWKPARGSVPLDRAVDRGASTKKEVGSSRWPGDNPHASPRPRPQAVAGKKRGA